MGLIMNFQLLFAHYLIIIPLMVGKKLHRLPYLYWVGGISCCCDFFWSFIFFDSIFCFTTVWKKCHLSIFSEKPRFQLQIVIFEIFDFDYLRVLLIQGGPNIFSRIIQQKFNFGMSNDIIFFSRKRHTLYLFLHSPSVRCCECEQ